jgi:hypothetical protein
LSDGTALINKDFDDFSMDVPGDLEFNKTDTLNGGRVLEDAVYDNGGFISFDDLYANPKYVHDCWEDENSTITIELFDLKEDGFKSLDDAVSENLANSSLIDDNNDIKTYNMSDSYGESFAVAKENDGKSVVIISGEDKDLITDMISTLEFK